MRNNQNQIKISKLIMTKPLNKQIKTKDSISHKGKLEQTHRERGKKGEKPRTDGRCCD